MKINELIVGNDPYTTIDGDRIRSIYIDNALDLQTENLKVDGKLTANGALGANGQVLMSNESGNVYWSNVQSISSGYSGSAGYTGSQGTTIGYIGS